MGNGVSKDKRSLTVNKYEKVFKMINSDRNMYSCDDIISHIKENNIDIHQNEHAIFLHVCIRGDMELIEWMYYEFYMSSDNSTNTKSNFVLKFILIHAPFNVFQWFWNTVKPTVEQSKVLLNIACDKNNVQVCQFIESKCQACRIETKLKKGISIDETDVLVKDASLLDMTDAHIIDDKCADHEFCKRLGMIRIKRDCDMTCALCFERKKCMVMIDCKHITCSTCFKTWYYNKRNTSLCTQCRKKFYYNDCFYILDDK